MTEKLYFMSVDSAVNYCDAQGAATLMFSINNRFQWLRPLHGKLYTLQVGLSHTSTIVLKVVRASAENTSGGWKGV